MHEKQAVIERLVIYNEETGSDLIFEEKGLLKQVIDLDEKNRKEFDR